MAVATGEQDLLQARATWELELAATAPTPQSLEVPAGPGLVYYADWGMRVPPERGPATGYAGRVFEWTCTGTVKVWVCEHHHTLATLALACATAEAQQRAEENGWKVTPADT